MKQSKNQNTISLKKILDGLARVEKGDYSTKINIAGMDPDLTAIANAYNEMIMRLRNAVDEIRDSQRQQADLIKKQQRIFDASRDIILQVNRYGTIVEVSKSVKDVLGYDPDEMIGRHFAKLGVIPDNMVANVTSNFKDAVSSGTVIDVLEFELISKNGTRFCMEASTKSIINKDTDEIEGFVVVMRDITRRSQAEDALRNNERKLHSIISSMEDIVFILDQDLRFVEYYQSPDLPDLTIHLKPEDYVGKTIKDIFPRSTAQDLEKTIRACIKTKKSQQFDYPWKVRNETLWFSARISPLMDKNSSVIGATAVIRDVTMRMNMEKAMEESEKKYRKIFENSPQGFILLDTEGRILDVNKKICDWLGYEPDEIIGKDHILYPFLTKAGKITAMRKFMQRLSGKVLPAYELEFITKTKEVFLGEVLAMQIRDEKEKIIQILVMITPVKKP